MIQPKEEPQDRLIFKSQDKDIVSAPTPTVRYRKTNTVYAIPIAGTSNPVIIKELDIKVYPKSTVRANYLLKFQTSSALYAASIGFVGVNSSTDSLMGTAYWPMNKAGSSSTVYSFMTDEPRFYSNNNAGVADSNVPFAGINSKGTFTTINVDIEYYNGGSNAVTLSIEFNRDLYAWPGQTQQMIEGSSVEYRYY